MKPNPFTSAVCAEAYIWAVALFFRYMEATHADKPDTWLAPVAMLSLLVFSVALMGFLFFYRPAVFLAEGKREEAVSHFFKTLGVFGVMTLVVVVFVGVLQ
ncbi:hypothetical protein FJY94_03470 [Candidatus Kaiserbacteria bacterium]|nr:hypothetical protein [Candidatus Kaiserbacteria bacterium]